MITALRRFTRQHPRSIAALVVGGFAAILIVPALLWGATDTLEPSGMIRLEALEEGVIWQATLSLVLLGIVALLGWSDIVGFRGPIDRGGVRPFIWVISIPAIILITIIIMLMSEPDASRHWGVIMIILSLNGLVGLSEELLFRGVLFGVLREKHRLWTAIALSSLIFGLIHIANLGAGQPPGMTAYQIFNAAILGALFCAVMLQTNSLWPPILLHMVWNAYVMLGMYTSEVIADPFADQSTVVPADAGFGFDLIVMPSILAAITALVLWRYTKRTGVSLRDILPTQGA